MPSSRPCATRPSTSPAPPSRSSPRRTGRSSGWSSTTARRTARARWPSATRPSTTGSRSSQRTAHTSARGGRRSCARSSAAATALREQPDVVVKLDGDLFLPAHYFEWVAETFARDPRAGIVGGVALIPEDGRWVPERGNVLNVNGVAKAYRVACLEEIGGLRPSMGWDGIDEYGARAHGWHVRVLTELHDAPLQAARLEAEGAQGALGGGPRQRVHGLPAELAVRARGLPRRWSRSRRSSAGSCCSPATSGRASGACRRSTTAAAPSRAARRAARAARRALPRPRDEPALDQPAAAGPAYWATGEREP